MVLRPALQGFGLDFSEPKVAHQLGLSLDPKVLFDRKMALNLLSFWQNICFSTYSLGNNAVSCQRNKSSLEYVDMRMRGEIW